MLPANISALRFYTAEQLAKAPDSIRVATDRLGRWAVYDTDGKSLQDEDGIIYDLKPSDELLVMPQSYPTGPLLQVQQHAPDGVLCLVVANNYAVFARTYHAAPYAKCRGTWGHSVNADFMGTRARLCLDPAWAGARDIHCTARRLLWRGGVYAQVSEARVDRAGEVEVCINAGPVGAAAATYQWVPATEVSVVDERTPLGPISKPAVQQVSINYSRPSSIDTIRVPVPAPEPAPLMAPYCNVCNPKGPKLGGNPLRCASCMAMTPPEEKPAPTVGRKDDSAKPRMARMLALIPTPALLAMGKVLMDGAKRYGAYNWLYVDPARYEDAIARHLMDYLAGNVYDADSGSPHMAHIASSALFLCVFNTLSPEALAALRARYSQQPPTQE